MKIRLRSAAKVNLSLDILSRRADGYHELASVVHTIGMWDEIEIERVAGEEISFSCSDAGLSGPDNLCIRAAKQWFDASIEKFGLQIHLEKHIPNGAGLGGGSGNAAAILLALNRLANAALDGEILHRIGGKLGADVPLFLDGGATVIEGIGDRLTPLSPLQGWLVVVKPALSLSTPAVYRAWDDGGFLSNRDTPALLSNWNTNLAGIGAHIGNDLERAVATISPLPTQISAILRQNGALGAQMTGSGSACFGLFETEMAAQIAADAVKSELAKDVHLTSTQVVVAPFCGRGVEWMGDDSAT